MEMLPLERRIWRGGARSATAPTYGERRLGLHRPLAAGATAAAAATAVAAVRIAASALLEAARLAAGSLPTLAAARLDTDFAACIALRFGARVATRGLTPAPRLTSAATRCVARSADRLHMLGHDRDFLTQAFRQRHLVERDLGQPLDVAQVIALVLGAEADRHALAAGARSTADAVDVLLGNVRQLEVNDMADARDVDAARGDVGRDQHLGAAGLELVQRAFALRLALVAVDRVRSDVRLGELLPPAVGTVLGARDHQHAVHRARPSPVTTRHRPQRLLLGLADEADELLGPLGRRGRGSDRDLRRIGQILAGQLLDRVRHRRREE